MLLLDDQMLYDRCMFLKEITEEPPTAPYVALGSRSFTNTCDFNVQAALGYAHFRRLDGSGGLKSVRHPQLSIREKLSDIPDIQLNPEPEGGVDGAWITGCAAFGKSRLLTQTGEPWISLELPWVSQSRLPFFYPL